LGVHWCKHSAGHHPHPLLSQQPTEEQAEEIAAYIEDNSDAEVEIHEGNQPVYSFIIGVE
jgi:dihydroxyacetone kinase-like predicted kinase